MVRLAGDEAKTLRSWLNEHYRTHEKEASVVIRHLSGGGIGTCTEVQCYCGCGRKDDITDYSIW